MGGSQSTRNLSVENRSSVQLSEAALRRVLPAATAAAESSPPPSQQETPQVPPPRFYKPHHDYSREEEYWTKRIESLKKSHHAINKKMEEEYDKAVGETAQMFKRAQTSSNAGKLPPCQKEKALVLECYNNNSRQPLLCAEFVNSFNECVSNKRTETTATGA